MRTPTRGWTSSETLSLSPRGIHQGNHWRVTVFTVPNVDYNVSFLQCHCQCSLKRGRRRVISEKSTCRPGRGAATANTHNCFWAARHTPSYACQIQLALSLGVYLSILYSSPAHSHCSSHNVTSSLRLRLVFPLSIHFRFCSRCIQKANQPRPRVASAAN